MNSRSRSSFPQPGLAQRVFLLAAWLLCSAMVFDLVDFATRTGALALPAYWMAAAGLTLGALALALVLHHVPLPIPWQEMHRSALARLARPVAIVLFGASWVLRNPEADIPLASLALSMLGAALVVGASWRGAWPQAQSRSWPDRQSPWDSESPSTVSRTGLEEDSVPPDTGGARTH